MALNSPVNHIVSYDTPEEPFPNIYLKKYEEEPRMVESPVHKYALKNKNKDDSSSSNNIALDDPVTYSPDIEPSPDNRKGHHR